MHVEPISAVGPGISRLFPIPPSSRVDGTSAVGSAQPAQSISNSAPVQYSPSVYPTSMEIALAESYERMYQTFNSFAFEVTPDGMFFYQSQGTIYRESVSRYQAIQMLTAPDTSGMS